MRNPSNYFELMSEEVDRREKRATIQKKSSEGGVSIVSEVPGNDVSGISAISSQLQEDKNKDYYEFKSQYLSDEIFFAKLRKKDINQNLLRTGNQISLNREDSVSKSVTSEKNLRGRCFGRGSLESTVALLMVATIGGGSEGF